MILSDQTFDDYGGDRGESVPVNRQIAYRIAEQLVAEHLGTPLEPTVYTGTFVFPYPDNRHQFLQADLRAVHRVVALYDDPSDGTTDRYTGTATILDAANALVALHPPVHCGPHGSWGWPHRVEVVYEAGLGAGVFTGSSSAMLALVQVASSVLEVMLDPTSTTAFGSPGLMGWSDMGHSEQLMRPIRTALGDNHHANIAAKLLEPLRRNRVAKI